MSLTLNQWGNAYYNTTICGKSEYVRDQMYCWVSECNVVNPEEQCYSNTLSKIMCQHGDVECLANLYQNCAANLASTESESFGFHYCSSAAYQRSWRTDQQLMEQAMSSCAVEVSTDFAGEVAACYESGQEDGVIWSTYAKRTIKLGYSRPGTPYTLVDGTALGDDATVLSAVCDAYSGTKPDACNYIRHQMS